MGYSIVKCFCEVHIFQGTAKPETLKNTLKTLSETLLGQRQVKCFFGGDIGYNPIPQKHFACLVGERKGKIFSLPVGGAA